MSRTDAHRPGWLQYFDDTVPVRVSHDHRLGNCVPETLEYARWNATQRFAGLRHLPSRCSKYEAYAYPCPQDRDATPSAGGCYTVWSAYDSWRYAVHEHESVRYPWWTKPRWRFPEHEHTSYKHFPDRYCEGCASQPEHPTCVRQYACRYPYYASKVYGVRPSREDRRLYYNGPERRRTRDVLRDAARDWNANGDTDIELDTRQHRHSVAWLLW